MIYTDVSVVPTVTTCGSLNPFVVGFWVQNRPSNLVLQPWSWSSFSPQVKQSSIISISMIYTSSLMSRQTTSDLGP